MISNTFNTAANLPQPYAFDFEREVAAFYRDHPEQKRKIFFIEASTMPGAICRGDETDEDDIIALIGSNVGVMESNKLAYDSGSRSDFYTKQGYGTICLNLSRKSQQNFLGYDAPASQSEVFIFDHETAHLLCENGLGEINQSERTADAYAVMRHIQRFGKDSPAIRRLIDKRAVELVFGDGIGHFTAPLVEKIIADSQTTDFSALAPAETAALATRYAAENPADAAMIRRMAQEFRVLQPGLERFIKGDLSTIRLLSEMVMATTDRNLFKWGAVAVRALLDGDVNICGERPPKPEGPEWTRRRDDIDARTVKFDLPQKLIVVSDLGGIKL